MNTTQPRNGRLATAILLSSCLLIAAFASFLFAEENCGPKPCKHSLEMFPMRFAIIGDRTGGHVPGDYGQVVQEIERMTPDFVSSVGDAIEGYGTDLEKMAEQWKEYKSLIEGFSMPIYLIPGNHDIWDDPSVELYGEHAGKPYYSFDIRGVHFVVVDTSRWEKAEQLLRSRSTG